MHRQRRAVGLQHPGHRGGCKRADYTFQEDGKVGGFQSDYNIQGTGQTRDEREIVVEQFYIGDRDERAAEECSSSDDDDDTMEQMRSALKDLAARAGWGEVKIPVRRARRGGWQGSAYFSKIAHDAVVIGERAGTRKEALDNVLTSTSRWAVSIVNKKA